MSTIVTPVVLNWLYSGGINGLILFSVGGALSVGGLALLPETMGIPLQEEV